MSDGNAMPIVTQHGCHQRYMAFLNTRLDAHTHTHMIYNIISTDKSPVPAQNPSPILSKPTHQQ